MATKRLSALPLFLLTIFYSSFGAAGCFPVPAFWGFAIACTADREGKGLALLCGAEKVERKRNRGKADYRITGKCVHKIPIKDSFGGDHGKPVENTFFFKAKGVATIFSPPQSKNVQESITIFSDSARTDKIGKIQGQYTCKKDPFLDVSASCDTNSYSTTLSKNHVLVRVQPLLRGVASDGGNIGRSEQPLKKAKPSIYAGIYRAGKDGYYLWQAKGWANFVRKWKDVSAVGFRLVDLETFKAGNDVYFTGVWRKGNDAHYLWRAKGWKPFVEKWKELNKKGARLRKIETYAVGGKRYYVGVWRSGKDGSYLWHAVNWKQFSDKWAELGKKNLRLVDIETYRDKKGTHYIGVWRSGTDGYYLWSTYSWKELVDKWKKLGSQKYRLIDLDILKEGNKTLYTGVWRAGSYDYALWRAKSWGDFVKKWKELSKNNLRLMSVGIQ